jgi:hypothetical protein
MLYIRLISVGFDESVDLDSIPGLDRLPGIRVVMVYE